MEYGLLKYGAFSNNLGDEIQSIAASAFLPQTDQYIYREELKKFSHAEPVKMILNGWYMHSPGQWPPSQDVEPLLTSIHIDQSNPEVAKRMLYGEGEKYFRQYGKPIGVRDTETLKLFRKAHIPAFFSGCLTLTLKRKPQIQREQYICAVDVSQTVQDWLEKKTQRPVYSMSNEIPSSIPYLAKFRLAQAMLELYQGAYCVVTSRLHAALPCLAYETPVLLIDGAKDCQRFSGSNALFRHCNEASLLNECVDFDFYHPQPNSSEYLAYRGKLVQQCVDFVGVDAYGQRTVKEMGFMEEKALQMQQLCQWRKQQNPLKQSIFRKAAVAILSAIS